LGQNIPPQQNAMSYGFHFQSQNFGGSSSAPVQQQFANQASSSHFMSSTPFGLPPTMMPYVPIDKSYVQQLQNSLANNNPLPRQHYVQNGLHSTSTYIAPPNNNGQYPLPLPPSQFGNLFAHFHQLFKGQVWNHNHNHHQLLCTILDLM
jgi:hypothetical protein